MHTALVPYPPNIGVIERQNLVLARQARKALGGEGGVVEVRQRADQTDTAFSGVA
jgi:hypothetical protein